MGSDGVDLGYRLRPDVVATVLDHGGAVVVEDGGSFGSEATGGAVSAPVARRVMSAVLRR